MVWKFGFELELGAPVGASRMNYAVELAKRIEGQIVPYFHADSEPSKVPGMKLFYHLTPAFQVLDKHGSWFASVVDDITLREDFDPKAEPKQGWYRLLTDDKRILRLLSENASPDMFLHEVLDEVGKLFGAKADKSGSIYRLVEPISRLPIALAAPLPGERERGCEIISAPISGTKDEAERRIRLLLEVATDLEFFIPAEAALHVHFDANELKQPKIIQHLVSFLHHNRTLFREIFETNPRCVRLGDWSQQLVELLLSENFVSLSWKEACASVIEGVGKEKETMSKYCDFNLRNILLSIPGKDTFEVRILRATLEPKQILSNILLLERMLRKIVNHSTKSGSLLGAFENKHKLLDFLQGDDSFLPSKQN